jgi:hypothetical protein
MKPTHADAVIRAHRDLALRNESPRAQQLSDVQGFRLGDQCLSCRAGATASNDSAPPKCRRCGAWWPVEAVEVSRTGRRGKRSGARKADHDKGLVEQSTYAKWIGHAGPDARVLSCYIERGRAETARLMSMTEGAVRGAVARARRSIDSRIELARLRGETN